jgi:superfamily II DNA or RNA helicase
MQPISENNMDNQDRNADGIAQRTPPPQQQKGGGDSSSRSMVKGEGQEEVQHIATERERGKYRQYEDSQIIIEKIRSYRTQRYPDSEIMKFLDNMPRRTYYNYVKKLQEQDLQIQKQWREENEEQVAEEMMIYRETLCQKLRENQAIIDNEDVLPKDKIQAIQQNIAISEKLVNFITSGRSSDMRSAKLNRYDAF